MSEPQTRATAFAERMAGLCFGTPDADRAVAIVGVCGNAAMREWTDRVDAAGPAPDAADIAHAFEIIASMAEATAHLADRLSAGGPMRSLRRRLDARSRSRIVDETRRAAASLSSSREEIARLCDWSASIRDQAQTTIALLAAEVETLVDLSSILPARPSVDPDVRVAAVAACETRVREIAQAIEAIAGARRVAGEAYDAAGCAISAIESAEEAAASHLDEAEAGDADAASLACETLSDLPPPPEFELTPVSESASVSARLVRILPDATTNNQEQPR